MTREEIVLLRAAMIDEGISIGLRQSGQRAKTNIVLRIRVGDPREFNVEL